MARSAAMPAHGLRSLSYREGDWGLLAAAAARDSNYELAAAERYCLGLLLERQQRFADALRQYELLVAAAAAAQSNELLAIAHNAYKP